LNAANAPKYIALLKEKLNNFDVGHQFDSLIKNQMEYFMNLLEYNPNAAITELQANPTGYGSTIDVLLNPPKQ